LQTWSKVVHEAVGTTKRPNGLCVSRRERAAQNDRKIATISREAVGWTHLLGHAWGLVVV
jgi:hypothetical protein